MSKKNLIIAGAIVVVVILVSLFLFRSPSYSADDFENAELVTQDQSLPAEELRLRALDLAETEPPREDEPVDEAARDAFDDYVRAGLYGEALRVSQEIEAQHETDASYHELKGDLLSFMHQYRDAVVAYERSLEMGGNRGSIYAKLGDLYLFHSTNEDSKKQALALYERSADLTTDQKLRNELRVKIEGLKNSL